MTAKTTEPEVKSNYSTMSRPVYCGAWTKAERKLLERLTADERREILLKAAAKKGGSKPKAKAEQKAAE